MVRYGLDKDKLTVYMKTADCSREEADKAIKGLLERLSERYYITPDKQVVPELIIMIPRKQMAPEEVNSDFEKVFTIRLAQE